MKRPCNPDELAEGVFEKIIGFGENSVHKSYYPELQEKINNLKKTEEELRRIKDELEIRVAERTRELEIARAELFEQNRLLEKKVTERTEELLLAKEKAEAASRVKSLFLTNMSHELRTPLNGIMGFSDMLAASGLNSQQAEFNRIIKLSSVNLLELINDMFDISEFEGGRIKLISEPFDLREAVAESLSMVRRQAENKNIELGCEISASLDHPVSGDRRRVEQIILNLLSNAVKFSSGGRVFVGVSMPFRCENLCQVEIAVSDEGIGIPPERTGEIFELFHQLDESSTKRHGGTGIGLAIVKGLVDMMRGEIAVESEVGRGSVFRVKLPFEIPAAAFAGGVNDSRKRPEKEALNILLAEDDGTNSLLITAIAERFGWSVTVARDGREAVAKFREGKFDIVLMDIQMPEMDGFEATRAIRKIEAETSAGRTPVVALTAYAVPDDRESMKAAGLDDYMTKPVLSPEALRAAVLGFLR